MNNLERRGSNWATLKCAEHVLSAERLYWLKEIAIASDD